MSVPQLSADRLRAHVREVPDFPSPGILFRDITPLLRHAEALREAVRLLSEPWRDRRPDLVLGIESRGFILGALVACELRTGFVPVRKAGKLPWKVIRESYSLEYGRDTIEMHEDAVEPGQSVLIVDDLIATGGTAAATCSLAETAGARVLGFSFLVELSGLRGRGKLGAHDVHVVLDY